MPDYINQNQIVGIGLQMGCLAAALADRALVRIAGADCEKFLQGLVTCDPAAISVGGAAHGALLSPQGKILFDFFLIRSTSGFLVDVAAAMAADFIRRLQFYKLRAQVEIDSFDPRTSIHACWDGDPGEIDGIKFVDPRLPEMGLRLYCRRAPGDTRAGDYHRHRIAQGMPEGGRDFSFGDAFPHEALMDQTGSVDFVKGCFVGQEVVSRMQHRGTARKRIVMIEGDGELPGYSSEILAGGRIAGTMGSSSGSHGLAMLRLDRVGDALEAGKSLAAGSEIVKARLQPWVKYGWK